MAAKKVLIVEDCNSVRFIVKRTLESRGMEVLELNNAEDFFQHPWRYKDINLLLLDVVLPGMDGLTALERLRNEGFWSFPVIMLTGNSDSAVVHRALSAGALNYILKPFTCENLIERVEQVMGPIVYTPDNRELELETIIRCELNRAKRGSSLVSLVKIEVFDKMYMLSHRQELIALHEQIKGIVREIDSVFITSHNFLLVLPFTGAEGAMEVIKKIGRGIREFNNENIKSAIVTFPNDGDSAETLLQALDQMAKFPDY